MRKLEVSDTFDCTPEEFWQNFFDPAFVARLDAELGFTGREELLMHEDDEKIHTRCRVTPKRELPPHIQQMLQNGLKLLQQVVNSGSSGAELPEPARKLLDWGRSTFKDFLGRDPKAKDLPQPQLKLSYVEEAIFNRQEQAIHWTITPDVFKDVSSFKGTITVTPEGDGCRRVISGEMHLGIPGAGEMIEQFLVDEIARNHSRAADLTRQAIAERRAS